ncbi:MAG: protein kinase domain-containing protein [Blastocatellia bacterium]
MAIAPGARLAHYEVLSLLGTGGMGEVYLARDTRLDRKVALKLLSEEFMRDESRRQRFEQEARVASGLNHPNIITVYEIGQADQQYFIAIEYVNGETLREMIKRQQLTIRDALDVAKQIASALSAAHEAGVVHRDIKPENIMVRPDGLVKVLDFGLAKQTEKRIAHPDATTGGHVRTDPGTLMGTPHYMSPEQARAVDVDARTDIFSLGAVLYEMITHRAPFEGETSSDLIAEILKTEPSPINSFIPDAPVELQRIISKAMMKKRADRYQSAADLHLDLKMLKRNVKYRTTLLERQTLLKSEPDARNPDYATRILEQKAQVPKTVIEADLAASSRKRIARIAIFAGLALALLAGLAYMLRPRPILTGRDTVLVADFENRTADRVFDDALEQALSVQLGQSPYLNLLPSDRVRETLKLMNRPLEERVTREVGREICQRRNLKALLAGTITQLDRNYSLTLEAINSRTGETIASAIAEAEGRDQVLRALGKAATELRGKLGESLASIQKFDVPIEQATTASLEALRDFSRGVDLRRQGQIDQAISLLKRAVELDGKFALACLQLGASYRDLRKIALGNRYLEQAYQLRDRVSERERLEISATYSRHITGDLEQRLENTTLLVQTYPQDAGGFHLHGNTNLISGQYEKALAAYREALRLDADYGLSRANLGLSLIKLNRFDEAREVVEQGLRQQLDFGSFHNRLYLIAFLRQDTVEMNRHVEWFAGKKEEYQISEFQAWSSAFSGRLAEADQFFTQAAAKAESSSLIAEKARILANQANLHAVFGLTKVAREEANRTLALIRKNKVDVRELLPSAIQPLESQPLAWTFALCGDPATAEQLAGELEAQIPQDTVNKFLWLPMIRATLELRRGNPGRALELLQPATAYEPIGSFSTIWLRGKIHLQMKNGAEAAAEFQKILNHRGWNVLSPLWPMAHLGLARAAAINGDQPKSRQAYQDLLALWKDADANLPLRIEVRKELDK